MFQFLSFEIDDYYITDTPQLVVFVRRVKPDLKINKFVLLVQIKGTYIGTDILSAQYK